MCITCVHVCADASLRWGNGLMSSSVVPCLTFEIQTLTEDRASHPSCTAWLKSLVCVGATVSVSPLLAPQVCTILPAPYSCIVTTLLIEQHQKLKKQKFLNKYWCGIFFLLLRIHSPTMIFKIIWPFSPLTLVSFF